MCFPAMRRQTDMGEALKGSCMCGAVKFSAVPESMEYGACHCKSCRRWAAGPYMAVRCGDTFELEDGAAIGVIQSSEWAERGFCTKCGSSIYYSVKGKPITNVSVNAFDDTSNFKFMRQVCIDEKPTHYSFANETNNMTQAEVMALFALDGGA